MELSNDEKASIINQHIKASVINSFNIQLSLMEENAALTPNAETISNLQTQLNVELAKQKVLNDELAGLSN